MKNILVTGGTGFIGSNLALKLLAEGDLLFQPGHNHGSRTVDPLKRDLTDIVPLPQLP